MKRKAIIAGAVVIAVLLLGSSIFIVARPSAPAITIRHVGSVHYGNLTTMTFEITNHTSDSYLVFPFEVQVRNGNTWTKFQGFDPKFLGFDRRKIVSLNPTGLASYTFDVTNFPKGSVVRFSTRSQKILFGFKGFLRRVQFNLRSLTAGGRRGKISLNPNDTKNIVAGLPIEVVSEEWIETVK